MQKALQILQKAARPNKIVNRDIVIFNKLMSIIDHPDKNFKCIHITGTNGKGSTSIKMASILRNAGFKTGLFTSPHIFEFLERIQINQRNCQEDYFAQTIVKLHQIQERNKLDLTFFEYLTATSFLYFKEMKCDYAVIEVGLGGRYDTTNVITPEVSAITSIAIDHERILGDTREKIAFEKAGIIKPNVPVVVGPNAELKIVFQEAKRKDSQLFLLEEKQFQTFEEENIAITRKIAQVLQKRGEDILNQHVQQGVLARQPCRMETIPKKDLPNWAGDKQIILDVGHNPNAIEKIIEYYNKNNRKSDSRTISVVFGASKGKNCCQSLALLQEFADIIYLISANHQRALEIHELKSYVGHLKHPQKYRVIGDGEIEKAMTYAVADKKTDTILVCGSFFIMPEVKHFLKVDGGKFDRQKNLTQQYDMKNASH